MFLLMDSWLHKWENVNNSTTHDDIVFVSFLVSLETYLEKKLPSEGKICCGSYIEAMSLFMKGNKSGCNEGGNNSPCPYLHKTALKRSQLSWKISICKATSLSVILFSSYFVFLNSFCISNFDFFQYIDCNDFLAFNRLPTCQIDFFFFCSRETFSFHEVCFPVVSLIS